jgi:hypothetical protein
VGFLDYQAAARQKEVAQDGNALLAFAKKTALRDASFFGALHAVIKQSIATAVKPLGNWCSK